MARLNFASLSIHDEPEAGNKQRERTSKSGPRSPSKKEPKHIFDTEKSDGEESRVCRKRWTKASTTGLTDRSATKPSRAQKGSMSSNFEIFDDGDPGSENGDPEQTATTSPSGDANTRLPLRLARVNSLLLPLSRTPERRQPRTRKGDTDDYDKENDLVEEEDDNDTQDNNRGCSPIRRSNSRTLSQQATSGNGKGKQFTKYREPLAETEDTEEEEEGGSGDDESGSLHDFIVDDDEDISYYDNSDNDIGQDEAEETPPEPPKRRKRLVRGRRPNPEAEVRKYLEDGECKEDFRLEPSLPKTIDLGSPLKPELEPTSLSQKGLRSPGKMRDRNKDEGFQQDINVHDSLLQSDSPTKKTQASALVTPPSSPSKQRLPSPSKEKNRIPPSPHRESADAFWDQAVINEWNDQYSPRKEITPGGAMQRLLHALGEPVVEDGSPLTSSPGKKDPRSPSKTALKRAEAEQRRAVLARKKSFDNKKASLAEDLLKTLDEAVSGGQVQKMAAETGGVKIIWSKTLQTTAGRANWKREKLSRAATDREQQPKTRHHATIELADRIIDSEDRLLNTLAHEYCHLANFMVSNVRNNPHGASFKEWGHKCTTALKDHPVYGGKVEVTTKHSYKIDYKYVWLCADCGQEYGRHSKSIDTTKSRCGRCKGVLQQIKPKPRGNASPKKNPVGSVGQKKVDEVVHGIGQVSLQN